MGTVEQPSSIPPCRPQNRDVLGQLGEQKGNSWSTLLSTYSGLQDCLLLIEPSPLSPSPPCLFSPSLMLSFSIILFLHQGLSRERLLSFREVVTAAPRLGLVLALPFCWATPAVSVWGNQGLLQEAISHPTALFCCWLTWGGMGRDWEKNIQWVFVTVHSGCVRPIPESPANTEHLCSSVQYVQIGGTIPKANRLRAEVLFWAGNVGLQMAGKPCPGEWA